MSETSDRFRKRDQELLEELKNSRRLLDRDISALEDRLAHPLPPISIDFELISKQAKEFVEQLDRFERERKGKEEQVEEKGGG